MNAVNPPAAAAVAAPPLVLLWNPPAWAPAPGPPERCVLTRDRSRLPDAQAVVFHLPTLRGALRLPKPRGQAWVAWSMESAALYPVLADPQFMRPFDLTMTYRFDSDVPVPYCDPVQLGALRTPPSPKTAAAPAVLFASNANERSGRTAYARELMRHLAVDSYGSCLRNRTLDEDHGTATLRQVIRTYRFTLAFENSIATDYVTEKFFNPLVAGSVPVYLGAPNVAELAPGERCYLDVRDFAGPAQLAAYLNALAADPALEADYQALLEWKRQPWRDPFARRMTAVEHSPWSRLADALESLSR